jgi:hypothetical protein
MTRGSGSRCSLAGGSIGAALIEPAEGGAARRVKRDDEGGEGHGDEDC